jgi:predicted enzyme related to lactoylglutathione lyase
MGIRRSRPVVHLELHTGDLTAACEFYAGLCGWRAERIRAGGGSYTALALGGGFGGGGVVECATAQPLWVPYVEVDDVGRRPSAPAGSARRCCSSRARGPSAGAAS